jgi:multidrug efflux pump subunit AcrB
MVGLVLAISAGIILGLTPRAEYLPEGEEQKTFAMMLAPPGYNLEEMTGYLREHIGYFSQFVDIDPDAYARGESSVPPLRYAVAYAAPGRIVTVMETVNHDEIDDLVAMISARFREVPGMISFATRGSIFASNIGGSRSINLDISGPRLAPLFEVGLEAFLTARTIFENPQVKPDPSNLTMGQPLLEVRPDWERAAELGFDADQLGYTIWALSDGAYVDEFFLGDDKIDMFLFGTGGTIKQPEDLDHLLIYSPNGGIVPLSAIATITETVNTETIRRVDGQRTVTIAIVPPRGIPLETAVETVQEEIVVGLRNAGKVPDDVTLRISGANDRLQATREALSGNFIVALLISYLLMVAIFSHWGYPLIIMTSVPIGISGGIVGLWLLNIIGARLPLFGLDAIQQPFDVITMLGFLVLIGTVVNNPILMVEKTLKNLREKTMGSTEAVSDAVNARLRPIIMSSITTICGLSPLVLLPGAGTELYRGLGTIVLFGILFSTLVTLTFMPSLLSLVLQLFERRADRAVVGDSA